MESTEIVLITGASRGLGLQMVKDFAQSGRKVIATARDPSSATQLKEVQAKHGDSVIIVALDVSKTTEVPSVAVEVSKQVDRIDILLNNAGIVKEPDNIKQEDEVQKLQEILLVNTVGPLAVTQAFLPLLSKSANPRVINFTSILGSISVRPKMQIEALATRTSKSALNMLNACLAVEIGRTSGPDDHKPIFLSWHPGWVATEMGNSFGTPPMTVEQSSAALLKIIPDLDVSHNGAFLGPEGKLPW